jgi:hypothetical protein
MDIGAFSDDNFDTKAWINNVLKNAENQKKKRELYNVHSNETAIVRPTSK